MQERLTEIAGLACAELTHTRLAILEARRVSRGNKELGTKQVHWPPSSEF
jgi:hypothetical protein